MCLLLLPDCEAQTERELVAELNALRTDPQAWVRHLEERRKWYRGTVIREPGQTPVRTQEGMSAVDEAIAVLRTLRPMRALRFSEALANAARDHVRDIGPLGIITHVGSDGSSTRARVQRYLPNARTLGETISFGPSSARAVLIDLIIDDGVPARSHRKILIDPGFRLAGAACGPHKTYGTACVIDLATRG
ncbi:MAG TPA: CAP domain-containing protein [Bryobacteraceae bacterium]|nr:CAP domain-containing protein [Bryobacteraceae bacterium]